MACPHFSRANGDCLLLQEPEEEDDDRVEPAPEEPIRREWCLSSDRSYRNCPVYRRFVAELLS